MKVDGLRRCWAMGPVSCMLLGMAAESGFAQRRLRGRFRRPARRADTICEGDIAPDFTLSRLDGKETITLSEFRGRKPVVLVFGSYT